MSGNIPLEIQMEIFQRIPDTKSLIRFRSVSKAWKSVIDDKEFVIAHTLRHHQAQPHHLLIRKKDSLPLEVKYVSIVDDDTFPDQKLSVFVPDSAKKVSSHFRILGTSHGLFSFYERVGNTAVIWNPSIRKSVSTKVPVLLPKWYYSIVVGFGVCPGSLDPKLVKITFVPGWINSEDENTSTQVEVFTLSSGGIWRSPLSSNLPHKWIGFGDSQVVIDGFIYWDAVDGIKTGGVFRTYNLIMSFDLTTEEFTKINLPDCLALDGDADLSLSNLRESLAVIRSNRYTLIKICDVWMMIGHGCTRSFNRLYSIYTPDARIIM